MKPGEFYEVQPDGRYRFRIDHHLINDANTCDRYFEFRHMPAAPAGGVADGRVWSQKHDNIKTRLGSWWSRTMELFYREMAFGKYPPIEHIMRFAADAWTELEMNALEPQDPEVFAKFGGLDGAVTMAIEYYDAFAATHFRDWQVVGAELGFGWSDEVFLGEDDRIVVNYGGKPDLVILDRGSNMIMPLDFKTKDNVPGNANVMYKPHPQTAGYIFALRELLRQNDKMRPYDKGGKKLLSGLVEPTKCVILVCARFRPTDKPRSGVRKPRFLPVYPTYTTDEIEEWRVSVMEKCRRLRESIERKYFPPRESACHLYYNGCGFRRVCSTPAGARNIVLAADFIRKEPWIPYSPEEE